MRILVAEDDPISAKLLERELGRIGHEAVRAADGLQAWELFEKEAFSVVITDWMMPELDGPGLCQRIRSLWSRGYTYVIVLTSRCDTPEDRETAMRAGADDFLTKPVDRFDLTSRLASAARIIQIQTQFFEQNEELAERRRELSETNRELENRERQLRQAFNIAELARNRFSQLFEKLPVAGFTYDRDGTVFEWNERASDIFFTPPHVAFGKKIWEIFGDTLVGEGERKQIQRLFEHGAVFENQDWNDGKLFLMVGGYPLFSADGEVTGAISTAIDVTKQKVAEAKVEKQNAELARINEQLLEANIRLEDLATRDGLTGIPNHRSFQEHLSRLLTHGKDDQVLSMAMIDVDKFKDFNDSHGHQAGDEVLILVARTLKNAVRQSDAVARYGGEEFVALFPGANEDVAMRRCEQIREAIAAIENPYRQITASFGVCQLTPELHTAEKFIQAADTALYEAKRSGRNCVRSYTSDTVGRGQSRAA